MAKSREKIQQIGFWDTEVSKPDHDEVCLWAYNNADLIIRTLLPERFDKPWLNDEVTLEYKNNEQAALEQVRIFAKANPRPNPRSCNKTLEYVLKSYTGYQDKMERIVGYADLLIETELPCIVPIYKSGGSQNSDDIFDGYSVGWTRAIKSQHILVEAKSILPTVGELMRQIQLYRTAFKGKFVVVSPDDSYAQILAEQGVVFIQYTPQKSN